MPFSISEESSRAQVWLQASRSGAGELYSLGMFRHVALLAVVPLLFGDQPYSALPSNYVLELENPFVRVSRVTYAAGDKLPEHSHPTFPTVYIYLTDGGPVRFTHKTPKFSIERPAVKAGSVRFNRNAQVETHEVEYLGETTSQFLRIELKTAPAPPHRDARLRTAQDFPWEDDQVRIHRLDSQPAELQLPAVVIALGSGSFRWVDSKRTGPGTAAEQGPFIFPGTAAEQGPFITVELKSKPVTTVRSLK